MIVKITHAPGSDLLREVKTVSQPTGECGKSSGMKNWLDVGLRVTTAGVCLFLGACSDEKPKPEETSADAGKAKSKPSASSSEALPRGTLPTSAAADGSAKPGAATTPAASEWLAKYQKAGSASEKIDVMGTVAASETPETVLPVLKQAINDGNPEVRLQALDTAFTLPPGNGDPIYVSGALSSDPDVRERAFDFIIQSGRDQQQNVYTQLLLSGQPEAMAKMWSHIEERPDKAWLEWALEKGAQAPAAVQDGVLTHVRQWLGNPEGAGLGSLRDAKVWWDKNQEGYDDYLLRINP